jgi:dTDP-4-dehydrorhamnose reductase
MRGFSTGGHGMSILLLGKDGQVGWQLQRSLAPHGEVSPAVASRVRSDRFDRIRS